MRSRSLVITRLRIPLSGAASGSPSWTTASFGGVVGDGAAQQPLDRGLSSRREPLRRFDSRAAHPSGSGLAPSRRLRRLQELRRDGSGAADPIGDPARVVVGDQLGPHRRVEETCGLARDCAQIVVTRTKGDTKVGPGIGASLLIVGLARGIGDEQGRDPRREPVHAPSCTRRHSPWRRTL